MVEVYVVVPGDHNYYADLTGRWYIGPTNVLWIEVCWNEGIFWPFLKKIYTFVNEDSIREIQGEFV